MPGPWCILRQGRSQDLSPVYGSLPGATRVTDRFVDSARIGLRPAKVSGGWLPAYHLQLFLQRSVGMRGDEDCWNFDAVAYEMLLKLQAVHLWHLKIHNQATGSPAGNAARKSCPDP